MKSVELGNKTSDWNRVSSGIPQWSILRPLLFLIYINDLPRSCFKTEMFEFADDTNIATTGLSETERNMDLKNVSQWLNANKLALNLH